MTYKEILKEYWGYDGFRGVQEQIIESIGSGRDTLGLMPTGGGKSITFQVPAMAMEGTCLVVTPLIALMKDQVRGLREHGIKAAAIHTGMTREQIIATMENCVYGGCKFLYVSPERLSSDLFQTKLKHVKVCMICVDESHCISQWGYDFRPSYLTISDVRKLLPGVPVLALTATATPRVVDDIQDRLGFPEKNVIRMSFYRENLSYVVRDTENKLQELKHILDCVPGPGIVYTRNRRDTKEISDYLEANGISATFYHAGLSPEVKDARQSVWTKGACRIMVATNAFGMGIDKPDVRTVVHVDIPDSIEAYFQEAGRAGRDGQRSYAVLLHSPGDKRILSKRISDNFPKEDFIRSIYDKLAYFQEMAVGDGRGCTFAFSLGEFCQHFSLPVIPTESALRILTRMGYIEYIDEMDYSAKLLFTAGRDDLYRIRQDSTTENIMNVILRLYSGIFTDYAYIDEKLICSRAGVSHETLYLTMQNLQSQGVVRYTPQRRTPVITWTRERIDSTMLNFDPEFYRLRLEEYKERIGAMMEYVTRKTDCRSRILLRYFGENQKKPCMHCDLCQENTGDDMTRGQRDTIREHIIQVLTAEDCRPQQIYDLPYDRRHIDSVLKFMTSEGELSVSDGKVILEKNYDRN